MGQPFPHHSLLRGEFQPRGTPRSPEAEARRAVPPSLPTGPLFGAVGWGGAPRAEKGRLGLCSPGPGGEELMQPRQAAVGGGEPGRGRLGGAPPPDLKPAPRNSFLPDLSNLRPLLGPGDAVPAGRGARGRARGAGRGHLHVGVVDEGPPARPLQHVVEEILQLAVEGVALRGLPGARAARARLAKDAAALGGLGAGDE